MTNQQEIGGRGLTPWQSKLWVLGAGVAVVGAGWVSWLVYGMGQDLIDKLRDLRLLSLVAFSSLLYGSFALLLGVGWWWLTGIHRRRPRLRPCLAIWARTQIGKYLPGNVVHYIGRQVLGRRIGLAHGTLVAAHLLELAALLVTAAVIVLPGLAYRHVSMSVPPLLALGLAVLVVTLVGWPLMGTLLRRVPGQASRVSALPRLEPRFAIGLLAPVLLLDGVFLLGSGLVFTFLLAWGWEPAGGALDMLWLYPLAWAAGTFTPGAPGGLGVREALLTVGLGDTLPPGEAASFAILVRVVTMLGDVVVLGIGWMIRYGEEGT